MFTLTLRNGCYGCPFQSRASDYDRYCGGKTVATNGGTWRLPPESIVDNVQSKRPEWCPLPIVVEAELPSTPR